MRLGNLVLAIVVATVGPLLGIRRACDGAEGLESMHTNRLIDAKSPYLLQHAHNPVDWYPWGDEAFEKAAAEDKPVFLSIGYSTCHWCHVMERESFEDEEVAALLNEHFVGIKVDREERPDIDAVYMLAAQLLGQGGGWPLTIVMTPDKKPFFAATYLPKNRKFGRDGLMTILPALARHYHDRSDEMQRLVAQVEERVERLNAPPPPGYLPPRDQPVSTDPILEGLMQTFDPVHGGFGRGMKFPLSHKMLYLMERHRRTGDAAAIAMVDRTLQGIRRGGVYDQIGFGVHRYATDPYWFTPHFEKMLYNQAQLGMAAVEHHAITGDRSSKRMAEEIYAYVLRDLRSPHGAFYSAEDADSEGEEGVFYLWRRDEMRSLLTPDEFALAVQVWGVEPDGNWVEQSTGERQPTNILHMGAKGTETLEAAGEEGRALLESARRKLFDHRAKRIRPSLDDKILTDWNGLMIASLARAGRLLHEPRWTDAARDAYAFLDEHLHDEDRRPLHAWRDGSASVPGMLSDHAFLAWGAVELYHATLDVAYLEDAARLMDAVSERFRSQTGGFHMTSDSAEELLLRPGSFNDNAEPCGNSVALLVFSELGRLTGQDRFEQEAADLEQQFASSYPMASEGRSVSGLVSERRLRESCEVVLVDAGDLDATRALGDAIRDDLSTKWNVHMLLKTAENAERLEKIAPFTKGQTAIGDRATAYVCRGFACLAPVTSIEELRERLADHP